MPIISNSQTPLVQSASNAADYRKLFNVLVDYKSNARHRKSEDSVCLLPIAESL